MLTAKNISDFVFSITLFGKIMRHWKSSVIKNDLKAIMTSCACLALAHFCHMEVIPQSTCHVILSLVMSVDLFCHTLHDWSYFSEACF
jgi:hypothetical protein